MFTISISFFCFLISIQNILVFSLPTDEFEEDLLKESFLNSSIISISLIKSKLRIVLKAVCRLFRTTTSTWPVRL